MTTRLRSRVSAVEEKVASRDPQHAIRLSFVEGYPAEGAEALLAAKGRDLSVPHRIVAFVTWADGAAVPTPLVDVTDILSGGPRDQPARQQVGGARKNPVSFPAGLHKSGEETG
jgi:hypothetical protein